MRYWIIDVDGTHTRFKPSRKTPSLEEMQNVVKGYIERVKVKGGALWVNEEGLLRSLPINREASRIAGQPIVGRVLFAERNK